MRDYRGVGMARGEMIPLVLIPTTSGTGSEAQSFALISHDDTHEKMACGDPRAMAHTVLLDPDLLITQPQNVAAIAGIDAMSHAIESSASTKRSDASRALSREAWTRLDRAIDEIAADGADRTGAADARNGAPASVGARVDMLLGAHIAGAAIERSMLGAAHACANPLTAEFGIPHGVAVGVMLPHVIRFNAADGANPYADLAGDAEALAARVERILDSRAALARSLRALNVEARAIPRLAAAAAVQWTARFNPRPVTVENFCEIYRRAMN
jgi:alcohol dehydrogenase